ncbi:MAG: T9SS type A sorting domain-containing protein [Muribaculaceae bacterium]|nr:T9SS type A sorting domain-containing protein [Muribaculaceae bacterium]
MVSEPDTCDVFSIQGVEMLRNADNAALNRLSPGIYIVRSHTGIRKIVKK